MMTPVFYSELLYFSIAYNVRLSPPVGVPIAPQTPNWLFPCKSEPVGVSDNPLVFTLSETKRTDPSSKPAFTPTEDDSLVRGFPLASALVDT